MLITRIYLVEITGEADDAAAARQFHREQQDWLTDVVRERGNELLESGAPGVDTDTIFFMERRGPAGAPLCRMTQQEMFERIQHARLSGFEQAKEQIMDVLRKNGAKRAAASILSVKMAPPEPQRCNVVPLRRGDEEGPAS